MLCCSLRRECWESEVEGVRGGEDGKLGINCVGSTVMTQYEDSSVGFVLELALRSFALARAEPIKASRWRNKDAMEEKWAEKKKRKIWRASNQSKNKMKQLILENQSARANSCVEMEKTKEVCGRRIANEFICCSEFPRPVKKTRNQNRFAANVQGDVCVFICNPRRSKPVFTHQSQKYSASAGWNSCS